MDIAIYKNCSELDALEDAWGRLCEQELKFVPSFAELRHQLEGGTEFLILAAIDNSQIAAIACFTYWNTKKSYEIVTKKLICLPVKVASLYGSSVLGRPNEDVIRKFFQLVIENSGFNIIDLGMIFVDSPLYNTVTHLSDGVIAWRAARKMQYWWLIQLPGSFGAYIASLPENTRKHLTRDLRKCERESPDFRITQNPEDVGSFLSDAEMISRSTYQWNLGYGTRNDEAAQQRLSWLAKTGVLRCYILYLRGVPCAFGWGELSHRRFVFEEMGYDPQYRKLSPGTTLVLRMIQDLIENTDCEVFDFKWGGEDGYKSRFGNISLRCVSMQLAPIHKPYALLIMALDQILNLFKKLIGSIIEQRTVKKRLRTILRRRGVGTF
jgi:hypothetical protein